MILTRPVVLTALLALATVLNLPAKASSLTPAMQHDAEAAAWFSACYTVTSIYQETENLYRTFADVAYQKDDLMVAQYSRQEMQQIYNYKDQLMDLLHARNDLLNGCRFVHRTIYSTVNAYKWERDNTAEAVDFLAWCSVCFNISQAIPKLSVRTPYLKEAYSLRLSYAARNRSEQDANNLQVQLEDHSRLLAGQKSIVHYCDLFYRIMQSTIEIYGLEQ